MRVTNAGIPLLICFAMLALAPYGGIAEDGATIVALETAHGREFNARLQYLAFARRADRVGLEGVVADQPGDVVAAFEVHDIEGAGFWIDQYCFHVLTP